MPAVALDGAPTRSPNGLVVQRLRATSPGAIAALTDLLTAALTPLFEVSVLRITVCLDTASGFRARVTPSGAPAVDALANQGNNLPANAAFTFLLPASQSATYNFRSTLAASVTLFQIEELANQ